jgi:nicotinamidase-related amidase
MTAESTAAPSWPPYSLTQRTVYADGDTLKRRTTDVQWDPKRTAVIVCDVWDYHHCINAVQRIEEMLPRMEAVLQHARQRGSVIIHAPSDCMDTYANHPARNRAIGISKRPMPPKIESWNSKIPAEATAAYPIDQSDGGEDDAPEAHRAWSEKLAAMGRNPGLPWRAQSPGLTIDPSKDFISDRGVEVWGILKDREIEHVLMIGVHTNMCVLGRPFGLRQLSQNGMDVVLVRDLTDCMYNPKRWPYVDHFTGNDLVISYVEQYICPTVTSDQIVGDQPISFRNDLREKKDLLPTDVPSLRTAVPEWGRLELTAAPLETKIPTSANGISTIRCSVSFATASLDAPVMLLAHEAVEEAWLNGKPLDRIPDPQPVSGNGQARYSIPKDQTFGNDDANVLVLKCRVERDRIASLPAPMIVTSYAETKLSGGWQIFQGDGPGATGIPLPAKFGLSPEIYYMCR